MLPIYLKSKALFTRVLKSSVFLAFAASGERGSSADGFLKGKNELSSAEKLIHTLVTRRLDYCNAVFAGSYCKNLTNYKTQLLDYQMTMGTHALKVLLAPCPLPYKVQDTFSPAHMLRLFVPYSPSQFCC